MPFRKDFMWGAATSAYQIEGAWNEDGRGPSVWDVYSQEGGRGRIYGNHTGDTACDHYHRFWPPSPWGRTAGRSASTGSPPPLRSVPACWRRRSWTWW